MKEIKYLLTALLINNILEELADEPNHSVSSLLREMIEEQLVKKARIARKQEALQRMFEMELPVDDWAVMEREIVKRWEECPPNEWRQYSCLHLECP